MTNLGDMEIEIKIDPAVAEYLNKSMADAVKLLTEAAGAAGMSMKQLSGVFGYIPVDTYAVAHYIEMLEQEKARRFAVGDGQTEIVSDPIVTGWNEIMQGFETLADEVVEIGRRIEQDKIKDRQRVKNDVRRKRKEVMRRKKL